MMEAVGCFELWRKKQAAGSPCRRRLPPGLSSVKGKEAYRGLARRVDGIKERVGAGEEKRVIGAADAARWRGTEDGRQRQWDADGLQGGAQRLTCGGVAEAVQ